MKWLKTDYIQAQAKKGRRQALECSIEHWEQLAGTTYRELMSGERRHINSSGDDYCALCIKYNCDSCPLVRFGKKDCYSDKSQYGHVRKTGFMNPINDNYLKKVAYPAFHREAKKMLKVLKEVHKKLYKK